MAKLIHGINMIREKGLAYFLAELDYRKKKKGYAYYVSLDPRKYPKELCQWFLLKTGRKLDLDNPRTYDEKIQWIKLYGITPAMKILSDKLAVRECVKQQIGEKYLTPVLGVWNSFDEINFDTLPERFVLKTNHGSGSLLVVKDKEKFDRFDAKKKFDNWMAIDFAFNNGFEMQYHGIQPKVFAEEIITDHKGSEDLMDYRVWCFDGKPIFISIAKDTYATNQLIKEKPGTTVRGVQKAFFDTEWNRLPFVYELPKYEGDVPRPDCLSELLQQAEKMAQGFPHARVDFYVLSDQSIRFGEVTFTHTSGICPWEPKEYDRIVGDLLHLPQKK